MQNRLARTSAQPPFLWHCSALATAEKPLPTHAQCALHIGNGDAARVTSTCLHSLHGKYETLGARARVRVPRVHPRNRSSFRIIATKLSAALPRFRITDDIPTNACLQKRHFLPLLPSFLLFLSLCFIVYTSTRENPSRGESIEDQDDDPRGRAPGERGSINPPRNCVVTIILGSQGGHSLVVGCSARPEKTHSPRKF